MRVLDYASLELANLDALCRRVLDLDSSAPLCKVIEFGHNDRALGEGDGIYAKPPDASTTSNDTALELFIIDTQRRKITHVGTTTLALTSRLLFKAGTSIATRSRPLSTDCFFFKPRLSAPLVNAAAAAVNNNNEDDEVWIGAPAPRLENIEDAADEVVVVEETGIYVFDERGLGSVSWWNIARAPLERLAKLERLQDVVTRHWSLSTTTSDDYVRDRASINLLMLMFASESEHAQRWFVELEMRVLEMALAGRNQRTLLALARHTGLNTNGERVDAAWLCEATKRRLEAALESASVFLGNQPAILDDEPLVKESLERARELYRENARVPLEDVVSMTAAEVMARHAAIKGD